MIKPGEYANGTQQKKLKSNPCVVCLGLLQEVAADDILKHPDLTKVNQYDSKVFTCSISMPACIMLREKSVRISLEEKFPKYFTEGPFLMCTKQFKTNNLFVDRQEIPLNKAWKIFFKGKLAAYLNKTFENSDICEFSINISMDYDGNAEVPVQQMAAI